MSSIEKAIGKLGVKQERDKKSPELDNGSHYPPNIPEEYSSATDTVQHQSGGSNSRPEEQNNYKQIKLDLGELERQGYITPTMGKNNFSGEYRTIKRPLLMNAMGKGAVTIENGNLIMLVSAVPGEGKTFTAFNLAMSFAMERDTTVMLVDSDILKRSLTHLIGAEDEPGLTDLLIDPSLNVGDVVLSTDVPKLNIIPAGRTHSHSTELLSSKEMEALASELSNRYPDRIVLFDAPPLLVTTEAVVLSQFAGQILVVVEAGKTPQHVVMDAVSKLDKSKVIGMLLNKSRKAIGSDYYGDGYGYGQYGN